jgi:hypothetical protein
MAVLDVEVATVCASIRELALAAHLLETKPSDELQFLTELSIEPVAAQLGLLSAAR